MTPGGIIQLMAASALATAIPSSVPERFKGEAIVITQFVTDVAAHCPVNSVRLFRAADVFAWCTSNGMPGHEWLGGNSL